MAEIISVKLVSKLQKMQEKKVLVGGCFDVLHPGHVIFLEKAKRAGDKLIVLLESDQKARELKGPGRPVHTQAERAAVLSALTVVDYIVMLPYFKLDRQYGELIVKIRPSVVASTEKEENFHHQRTAKMAGAKFKVVTGKIGDYSSSQIAKF